MCPILLMDVECAELIASKEIQAYDDPTKSDKFHKFVQIEYAHSILTQNTAQF